MENTLVAEGGWESITFLLPPEDILAHLTARQRAAGFFMCQKEPSLCRPTRKAFGDCSIGGNCLWTPPCSSPHFSEMKERVNAQNELLEKHCLPH